MKSLINRILQDARCLDGGILKVDCFINHQIDPYLVKQVAVEFMNRFAEAKPTKILTIESSGIAPAVMLGYVMELPVVFAKKEKPSTMNDFLETKVHSFTKQNDYTLIISREYLSPEDRVLFVDDFLAFGNAGLGILDICRHAVRLSHHRRPHPWSAALHGQAGCHQPARLGGRAGTELPAS